MGFSFGYTSYILIKYVEKYYHVISNNYNYSHILSNMPKIHDESHKKRTFIIQKYEP